MDKRRKCIEDADLDVATFEPDRICDRVAIDLGPGDRSVNQTHIDLRQTGFPGDGPFGFAQGFALDAVDQPLEFSVRDLGTGPLALLRVRRRDP